MCICVFDLVGLGTVVKSGSSLRAQLNTFWLEYALLSFPGSTPWIGPFHSFTPTEPLLLPNTLPQGERLKKLFQILHLIPDNQLWAHPIWCLLTQSHITTLTSNPPTQPTDHRQEWYFTQHKTIQKKFSLNTNYNWPIEGIIYTYII